MSPEGARGSDETGWPTESDEWVRAAEEWRDRWHRTLPSAEGDSK